MTQHSGDIQGSNQTAETEDEIHATCVAADGPEGWRAALLLGPPGAGKSALALAVIARGGRLVADDRVALRRDLQSGALIASATAWHRRSELSDAILAHGLGLLRVPSVAFAPVMMALRLTPRQITEMDLCEKAEVQLPVQRGINLRNCTLPLIETGYSGALGDGLYCLLHCGALVDPDAPLRRATEDKRT